MPLFFSDFDSEKRAFVNPDEIVRQQAGFP